MQKMHFYKQYGFLCILVMITCLMIFMKMCRDDNHNNYCFFFCIWSISFTQLAILPVKIIIVDIMKYILYITLYVEKILVDVR